MRSIFLGKSLVLAEKPSVAREIARTLGCAQKRDGYIIGQQYIVTWALGHLVTLADPAEYDKSYEKWSLETLPMLPTPMRLTVIKETAKQFTVIKHLLTSSEVSDVIIATDSGREGELVARWILIKAGSKKPAKRLWISSQTDKAIRDGFAALKPAREYDNLFKSAQSRAEADWLVGLNVTRALTLKHNASLSAGRVQTPTLAMIIAREEEIRRFKPREYYLLKLGCSGFSATWIGKDRQSRLEDKERAETLLRSTEGKQGIVSTVTKQKKQKPPPSAYDLTELQRDANRIYAYTAKQTLALTQSLYERHKLVTYPRTDSRFITKDVARTLPDRLRAIATGPYRQTALILLKSSPLSVRYLVDEARVTDHHAILPTEEPMETKQLTPEERNIHGLIVRRFMAVLSAPFEYEDVRIDLLVGGETFTAKGKTVLEPGWKAVSSEPLVHEEEEDDEKEQILPSLQKGDRIDILSRAIVTGKTRPPSRYNEATLLTAMENPASRQMSERMRGILKATSGLGTPATRADIIEKLFSSFYVERRGKEIIPTSKGTQLIAIVPPDLKSAELTGTWEQELAGISQGTADSRYFIARMRDYASKLVSMVLMSDAKYTHDNITREKCPDCGQFLLEVKGKKGIMRICPDRECGYRKSQSMTTNARCPSCHQKLELRGDGEKRVFACICGYREKWADFEKRRDGPGATKGEVKKYMLEQDRKTDDGGEDSALAKQLARWMEANWTKPNKDNATPPQVKRPG